MGDLAGVPWTVPITLKATTCNGARLASLLVVKKHLSKASNRDESEGPQLALF